MTRILRIHSRRRGQPERSGAEYRTAAIAVQAGVVGGAGRVCSATDLIVGLIEFAAAITKSHSRSRSKPVAARR